MKIFVNTPDEPKSEVIISQTDSVGTLKNQIFDVYGLFRNFYKLFYDDVELDSDLRMLKDYGVKDGSTIHLEHWHQPQPEKTFLHLNHEWRRLHFTTP